MLWYKGWLETRLRVLFAIAMVAYSLAMLHWGPMKSLPARQQVDTLLIFWLIVPVMLGGAGIKTPAAFRSVKGMHGSMFYTLTLPVTRLRLILVRSTLGLVEVAGVFVPASIAAWLLSPVLSVQATLTDALEDAFVIAVCGSSIYFVSVLFATFLDDVWQIWGSVLAVAALDWLSNNIPVSPAFNLFQAMGVRSPLVTHYVPWTSMGAAVVVSGILFFAAVKIAEAREY